MEKTDGIPEEVIKAIIEKRVENSILKIHKMSLLVSVNEEHFMIRFNAQEVFWCQYKWIEMHLIVYTSEFTLDDNKADIELSDIECKAKNCNPITEITGVLFYHKQRFVQIIEGERESLESLMTVLEKDNRHKNIERLVDQEINKRGFKQWNMDTFNLSKKGALNKSELEKITAAYNKNIEMDSAMLVTIYKYLLNTHELS